MTMLYIFISLVYVTNLNSLWELKDNMQREITNILDFKLSPCFEYCMYSFGYFPGVRLWFANVSEPSIRSIFKGWM